MAPWPRSSTIASLFVRNGEVLASLALVLATDEVRNLLILSLLDGALVVLLALAKEVLLDVVDAYEFDTYQQTVLGKTLTVEDTHPCQGHPRSSRPGPRRRRRC